MTNDDDKAHIDNKVQMTGNRLWAQHGAANVSLQYSNCKYLSSGFNVKMAVELLNVFGANSKRQGSALLLSLVLIPRVIPLLALPSPARPTVNTSRWSHPY